MRYLKRTTLCIACLFSTAMLFLCGLQFLLRRYPSFAAWADAAIGAPLRSALSRLSSRIPFSLTGLLLLSAPLLLILLLVLGYRSLDKRGGFSRFLLSVLSLLCIFALLFSLTLSPGYHKTPLFETLSLRINEPSAEELAGLSAWLSGLLREEIPPTPLGEELVSRLQASYRALGEKYGFFVNPEFSIKEEKSGVLSAMGIIGLYAFPFGEITVNLDYPASARAFTLSHEMAHALGFSREEEADLMGFMACLESGDEYLTYVGALGMLQRVLPDLKESSSQLWETAAEELPSQAKNELREAGHAYERAALATMANEEKKSGHEGLSALLYAYYRRFVSPEGG